jgi:glucokinase
MLTVGTGVGGGLVVGRRLYRGATGLGAEVGHLIVDPEGAVCGCGNRGCLEAMASGTALQRIGGGIPGESLLAAARAGDAHARSLFGEIGGWLGLGLASLVTLFDPEVIVIGGGLRPAIDLMGPALRKRLETYVFGRRYRTLPPIVPARLAEAGLVGAAALACRSS